MVFYLAEVSLEKSLESLAVSGLISGHLMNGIVDCIEVGSLSSLCKISLASSRAVLCIDSHLHVLLRAVR